MATMGRPQVAIERRCRVRGPVDNAVLLVEDAAAAHVTRGRMLRAICARIAGSRWDLTVPFVLVRLPRSVESIE